MEKKKIVLGIDVMEKFEEIFHPSVIENYELYTTSYVWNTNCWSKSCIGVVYVKDFSGTEVENCIEFIRHNDLVSKVGINNGTAIYYAFFSNMTFVTTDHLTERICGTLGVSYVSELSLKPDNFISSMSNTITKINNINKNEGNVTQLYGGTAESFYKTNISI